MAQNPTITSLDAPQVTQRTFDVANDAVRVSVGSAEFIVSGESLQAQGVVTALTSGAAIPLVSCAGVNAFQLYIVANTTTTGDLTVRLDLSPSATGTPLYQTSLTLTLPGSSAEGAIVVSTILDTFIAAMAQVTIEANGLAGTDQATVFLIGNTF